VTKAVVFDLFETLVDYDGRRSREFSAELAGARRSGRDPEAFHQIWIDGGRSVRRGRWRRASPRGESPRARWTSFSSCAARSRARSRVDLGGEDTSDIWPQTPFADTLYAEVFSSSCGFRNPSEAVFVGDGANDELAGAERVGMRAIQIGAAQPWSGERISAIPDVLDLL
jgi:FMN phosphatase YigB (HAD superfamily)